MSFKRSTLTRKLGFLFTFCFVAFGAAQLTFADNEASTMERKETMAIDLNGRTLLLRNLVGKVTVLPASSNQARIEATVVSGGSDAKSNLALIQFEQNDLSKEIEVRTLYPVEDHRLFYYNPKGTKNSNSTRVKYQQERVRVMSTRGLRKGLDLHVDFVVYLPQSSSFKLTNAVGDVTANDIQADLKLSSRSGTMGAANNSGSLSMDVGSGKLTIAKHRGKVSADTGSGSITIEDVDGATVADTGSGSISIDRVTGAVSADTGSGSVSLNDVVGDTLVDTGSGKVRINNVRGSLNVDTGSGAIIVDGLQASKELLLDTGSGRVQVSGDFSHVMEMNISTGSGSVKLRSTHMPSMRLDVETGSGITIDFADMRDVRTSKDTFRGVIGKGEGRGSIETGSGSVSFLME